MEGGIVRGPARRVAVSFLGVRLADKCRPDLTPFTISTGTNLEVYDQSWAELREEYLALTKECGDRMKAVQEKRERLANVDNGVSDSVVELAKVG